MVDIILVPLDGSELAEATLPYAASVQRDFSSKLILFRVVGVEGDAGDCVGWRLYQVEARSYLEGIVDDLQDDLQGEKESKPKRSSPRGKPSDLI